MAGTIAPLAADVLLVPAIVYDWRSRGRPHLVYLRGLVIVLAVQAVRIKLSQTSLWCNVTDLLLSLAR